MALILSLLMSILTASNYQVITLPTQIPDDGKVVKFLKIISDL